MESNYLNFFCRFPSLSQQLLLQLYHIDERVFLICRDNRPIATSALASSTPCKVSWGVPYNNAVINETFSQVKTSVK